MQTGTLGISDTSLSLPTKVGRQGVVQILEPAVNDQEREGLHKSAQSLKDVFAQIS
jgi:L-lactate dehydrogenase